MKRHLRWCIRKWAQRFLKIVILPKNNKVTPSTSEHQKQCEIHKGELAEPFWKKRNKNQNKYKSLS